MDDLAYVVWTVAALIAIGHLYYLIARYFFGLGPLFDYIAEQRTLRKMIRRSRRIDDFIACTGSAPQEPLSVKRII